MTRWLCLWLVGSGLLVTACGTPDPQISTTLRLDAVTAAQVKAYRVSVLPALDRDRHQVTCERFFCGTLANVPLLADGSFAFDPSVTAQQELKSIAPQKGLVVVAEAFDAAFAANGTNPGTLIAQGCTFDVEVRSKKATDVSVDLRDPLTDAQKGTICQP